MIFQEKQHHDMRTIAVVLFSFFLPIYPRIATWIAVSWFILWIFGGQPIKHFSSFKHLGMWPAVLFYLLYLVGLSWSDFPEIGGRELETKLSLFVFPLLLFVGPSHKQTTFFPMRVAYLMGCTIAMIICLGVAGVHFLKTGVSTFSYKDLGAPLSYHPTYFALYLNFGIVLAIDVWSRGKDTRYLYRFFILIALVFILLLAARMQLIMLLLIAVGWFFWDRKKKGLLLKGILQAGVFAIVLAALSWAIPTTRHRINRAITELNMADFSSGNIRSELWSAARNAWELAPLIGHGTGAIMPVLEAQYEIMGCETCLEGPLNAHNQYLQTAVELGWLGLLLLIAILVFPFFFLQIRRQSVFLTFMLLFACSCLTESMLSTQRGVMFFGFFFAFFAWNSIGENFLFHNSDPR